MSSLQNLKTPDNYQPAPSASIQKGGSKKRKGGGKDGNFGKIIPVSDDEPDLEMGPDDSDILNTNNIALKEDFANDNEYDLLEKGEAGSGFKAGGSRKRRHGRKSRKTRKGGKTHRRSKKGGKRSRKSRK